MIWQSVPLMTAIDLLVVAAAIAAIIAYFRVWQRLMTTRENSGFALSVLGLALIGTFYFADLIVMYVLPNLSSQATAIAVMEDMHLNYAWFVMVSGVALIALGSVLTGRRLASLVDRLSASEQSLTEELDQRKRTETLNTRLGRIVEDSLNEVYVFDSQTLKFEMVNRGARENLGYSMEELRGMTPVDVTPEFTFESFQAHLRPMLDGDKDSMTFATVRQRKDGSLYDVEVRLHLSRTDDNSVIFAIVDDVTERNEIDEGYRLAMVAAEEANDAKSQFLASMSHELRTPLNAILGFSEIMSLQYMGPLGSAKYTGYAEDIHNSAAHLLLLVNDLLDLSTIEAGKQTLKKEKLTVEALAAECSKIVGEKASDAGIAISLALPEGLPPLNADKRAIKQVLLNLLDNAIKFSSAGDIITLSATATATAVAIKVEDTGEGMPAEALSELTKPFVRGEEDPHMAMEGWGLGLAITKSLVELHRGELIIESEVGKGTTVTVILPNKR